MKRSALYHKTHQLLYYVHGVKISYRKLSSSMIIIIFSSSSYLFTSNRLCPSFLRLPMKKVMPESTRIPVVPKNTCALTLVNITCKFKTFRSNVTIHTVHFKVRVRTVQLNAMSHFLLKMIVSVSTVIIQHALVAAVVLYGSSASSSSSSSSYGCRGSFRCSALRMSKGDGLNLPSSISNSLQTLSQRTDNELKTLMDSMPLAEKYTLLLQSYSTSILERRLQADKRIDLFQNMESLYNEMIQQSIAPEPMAAQAMIDASSKFGNVAVMSKAARLIRAGQLTAVSTTNMYSIDSPTYCMHSMQVLTHSYHINLSIISIHLCTLFIHLFIYPPIYLAPPFVYLFIIFYTHLYIHLPIYRSINLSIKSIHLSTYLILLYPIHSFGMQEGACDLSG